MHSTDSIDVSLIMAVYNETSEQILAILDDICAQTYPSFEYIVVLDNPHNIAANILLEKYAAQDTRCTIIKNDINIGLGASLNKAIVQAKGTYLIRMDADDRCPYKDRIAVQRAYMDEHPHVDLLFTWWKEIDEKGNSKLRTPPKQWFDTISRSFFTKSMLLHPTLMMKKSIFGNYTYPEITRPEDFILFVQLIRDEYTFDVLESVLYDYQVDRYDIQRRYKKVHMYSEHYVRFLHTQIQYFWKSWYFWVYFGRILFEYLVSRNMFLFHICHAGAGRIWKYLYQRNI